MREGTPSAKRTNILGTSENATITKLTIEEGIKEIKCGAFEKCTGIKGNLVIPDGVTKIGRLAFNKCSGFDGTLTLPSSLKSIVDGAFQFCSGFTGDLVIPEGVETLGTHVFNNCSGFNGTLTLPSTLKNIGGSDFQLCSGLKGDLVIPEGVETIGTFAFNKCSGFNGTLTLPSTLKSIGKTSFQYCSGLTGDLVIPEGVEKVEDYTFYACSKLIGDLIIPDSVESVGNCGFYGCSGFNGILKLSSNLKTIGEAAFYNCSSLTGSLNLPDKIESVGQFAFNSCRSLTGDLVIPNSITTISRASFQNCKGLTGKLVLPDSITTIEPWAFYTDRFTGTLTLPSKLEILGEAAFGANTNFENTKIVIQASLKKIGIDYEVNGENLGLSTHDFYNFGAKAEKLEAFEVEEENENFVAIDGVLYTKDKKRLISYPRNKKGDTYEILDGVVTLDEFAFASNMNLQTLKVPDSLTFEPRKKGIRMENITPVTTALYSYSAIQDIILNETNPNYTSIDGVVYTKDKKQLMCVSTGRTKEVIIPDGVETIIDYAVFPSQVARSIPKMYIPSSLTNISNMNLKILNNYGAIKEFEIAEDNPAFTLDSNGKIVRK